MIDKHKIHPLGYKDRLKQEILYFKNNITFTLSLKEGSPLKIIFKTK